MVLCLTKLMYVIIAKEGLRSKDYNLFLSSLSKDKKREVELIDNC